MNCTGGFGARKEKNQSTQTVAKLMILDEPHWRSCISVIGGAMKQITRESTMKKHV
jgi:hypothetical protein